ncbi:MAG TPA: hypothetical protein PK234_01415 [Candidatus Portnoybacteria bacterium]|jgi:phosphopantetheine adenylyltransferase|nr:hypothetical protein [Candidatus Portnoybacteria bacterium]MDD5752422.1 hypothetical protein [Candidatus Portnoybacteria bacterium]HOZ16513.1 hypothetical protein [Candidatus Portnoybacteria bacterium]HPH52273.1 hypothetical protein [Candidatus Portnoybacteria bacterium]HPM28415.1 hypothetical protein [Candidatus Portnoybacteria bacterium]
MGESIEKQLDKELRNKQKEHVKQLEKRMEELEVAMDHETDKVIYKQICDEYKAGESELDSAKRLLEEEE